MLNPITYAEKIVGDFEGASLAAFANMKQLRRAPLHSDDAHSSLITT